MPSYSKLHLNKAFSDTNGNYHFGDSILNSNRVCIAPQELANKEYIDSLVTTLQNNINTEKSKIDNIIDGSSLDYDTIVELKNYIDHLDTEQGALLIEKTLDLTNKFNELKQQHDLEVDTLTTDLKNERLLSENNLKSVDDRLVGYDTFLRLKIQDIDILYLINIQEHQKKLDEFMVLVDIKDDEIKNTILENKSIAQANLDFIDNKLKTKMEQDYTTIHTKIDLQSVNLTNLISNNRVAHGLLETKHQENIDELSQYINDNKTSSDASFAVLNDDIIRIEEKIDTIINFFFRGDINMANTDL
jgi:translation initiation factor 2 alpha subunit (eIF-2alpha)